MRGQRRKTHPTRPGGGGALGYLANVSLAQVNFFLLLMGKATRACIRLPLVTGGRPTLRSSHWLDWSIALSHKNFLLAHPLRDGAYSLRRVFVYSVEK